MCRFLNGTFNTSKYTHIHRKDSRTQLYYQLGSNLVLSYDGLKTAHDSYCTLYIRAILYITLPGSHNKEQRQENKDNVISFLAVNVLYQWSLFSALKHTTSSSQDPNWSY